MEYYFEGDVDLQPPPESYTVTIPTADYYDIGVEFFGATAQFDGIIDFVGAYWHKSDAGGWVSMKLHEPNLALILNTLGFTNIQESTVKETFSPGVYEVKLYAEFAGYYNFNNLSWYPVGTTNYNMIFSGEEGGYGYVKPPITKTFTATTEFGLSFCSPEARYFTETSKNPDGLKHAQVYENLDNPDMFLIGFENRYGQGDKDFNDMVISLEIVNKRPNTPSMPSGNTTTYRNIWYVYSTRTTDPDGDDVRYEVEVTGPDGIYWSGIGERHKSNETDTRGALWETTDPLGIYQMRVRAQDIYGLLSSWSPSLTITVVNRAPNTPSTPSGTTSGYTGTSYTYSTSTTDPDGDNVCYKFDWGDGSNFTTGSNASGSTASATHSWGAAGTYNVTVAAQDIYWAWSGWSKPTLVNIYYPLSAINISPSNATMDVGQSKTFTSTVSGGTPPYTYQWGAGATLACAIVNAANAPPTGSSWTFTPPSADLHYVVLIVTDSVGYAQSITVSVTVNPALCVSISPNSVTMDVGQSQLFTSTVSGGTLPYTTYQWYLNGLLVPDATSTTWNFQPTSTGSYTIYLIVTDAAGNAIKSNTASVTVTTSSGGGGGGHGGDGRASINPTSDDRA